MAEPIAPAFASPVDTRKGATLRTVLMHAVICVSAGVALDAARVIHARYNLQSAADAAALAASHALGNGIRDDVEIRKLAESHFRANVGNERIFGSVGALSVVTDHDAGRVFVGADVFLPMTLTRFMGYGDVEILSLGPEQRQTLAPGIAPSSRPAVIRSQSAAALRLCGERPGGVPVSRESH